MVITPRTQEPLRLTLCSKGRRKMVLLHPRTMDQLYATIKQKFRSEPDSAFIFHFLLDWF